MTASRLSRGAPFGLAAAFALSLTAAMAQTPPAGAPPMPGPQGDRAAFREHRREGMAAHHAQMIADYTTVLRLSPAQAQALQAAMIPPKHDGSGPPGGRIGDMASQTTLQHLDTMQARMGEREGRMREHLAAMRAFYTSLAPDQQKSFDALTRLTHGGMHRRHGMGMGGMGMRPGMEGMGGPGMRHGPPPAPGA